MKKKVMLVFGTRPEAIKMVPLVKKFDFYKKEFDMSVCVTAQHRQMLDSVLHIFDVKPKYDLNVMQDKQTLFHITREVLGRFEEILEKAKPDLVLVHGDTTTTFAITLASYYKHVAVGHVEAGLRSYDKQNPFPEEVNRLATDAICNLHFAPTETSKKALLKENISDKGIFITGNTIIDALHIVLNKKKGFENKVVETLCRDTKINERIILVTAHRRENHGKPFEDAFKGLATIAKKYKDVKIVYPIHLSPAVQEPAKRILGGFKNVYLLPPLDYLDLARILKKSYLVVTDSGGLQEEAPSLGKPVLVMRKVTERPEAVEYGTVKIVGTDTDRLVKEISLLLDNKKEYMKMAKAVNPYGDGKASERTIEAIRYYFKMRSTKPPQFKV
jgi:UDP-N-acetylglucosamine 2-epimerase (non-hydrolysing)